MKKIIIILCVTLSITMIHAQKWEHTIGLQNRDEAGLYILEHYDYGYISSVSTQQGSGNWLGLIIKTDINGNVLWEKQMGLLPEKNVSFRLRYDKQGNIYTFGLLKSPNFETEFPFIVKLNACGEKLWCRMFALEGYIYGIFKDAIILENSDLLCLAYMPEDDPLTNNNILLYRISSEGDLLWIEGYATHEDHPYYGDPNGHTLNKFGDQYIISGTVYSSYPEDPNPYHVWTRPMFIGISEDFEEQWILEFGIADSTLGTGRSVVAINDTLYMGIGKHRFIENGALDKEGMLMFFNNAGEQLGYHLIKDEQLGSGIFQSLMLFTEKINNDKYLVTAGYWYNEDDIGYGEIIVDTAGNVYDYTIREHTMTENYLVKTFDSKYTFSTGRQLPGQAYCNFYHYKLNENLEHDTLYPGIYKYDSLCENLPIQSEIIDLIDCEVIVSIREFPSLEQYRQNMKSIAITASPNPSNTGEVLLEYENAKSFTNLELHVSNIYGKLIHSETVLPWQGASRLYTNAWPAGMYIVNIYSNGQLKGKCKIVVE